GKRLGQPARCPLAPQPRWLCYFRGLAEARPSKWPCITTLSFSQSEIHQLDPGREIDVFVADDEIQGPGRGRRRGRRNPGGWDRWDGRSRSARIFPRWSLVLLVLNVDRANNEELVIGCGDLINCLASS